MKNVLEIILVTYNRKQFLKNTLEAMFLPESPTVKYGLDFTILDNASTDGTSELCLDYEGLYPNIRHIRRSKNIGGNANIAGAFALAKKEYVWIIADDDFYDWSAWQEIQQALDSKLYDVVLTLKKSIKNSSDYPKIIKELCFVPAGIYKTANITGGVLQNAYDNIPFKFPHLAAACAVLNKNGKFYVPQKELISKIGADRTPCEILYLRDSDGAYKPEIIKNMFWGVSYINSLQLIKDRKLRAQILNNASDSGFFSFIFTRFRDNKRYYGDNFGNILLVWKCLNFAQRIKFFAALILIEIFYFYVPFTKASKSKKIN
ncbi:MAG: glycosyltransferase family 2 protein [Endomicrobium sp.]|jgi:glycosyltransferase involved in cell wall biosynthesis|nr:glycosyltransferase family 2 protein [Endomicrobium sp.]